MTIFTLDNQSIILFFTDNVCLLGLGLGCLTFNNISIILWQSVLLCLYVYYIYPSDSMSKRPKQLPNVLKENIIKHHFNQFQGVLFHVHAIFHISMLLFITFCIHFFCTDTIIVIDYAARKSTLIGNKVICIVLYLYCVVLYCICIVLYYLYCIVLFVLYCIVFVFYCIVLYYLYCIVFVLYCIVLYCVVFVLHHICIVLYYLYCIVFVLCCICIVLFVLYCIVLHCIICIVLYLYCIVFVLYRICILFVLYLYCIVLYCIVLYCICIVLYCTQM